MFDNIEDVKKRKILQAALEEFAVNGYDFSTNVVAKKAGVSKGLIFFHFENKKGVILALVDETIKLVEEKLMADYEKVPRDFFERLKYVINVKYEMAVEMPVLSDFSWRLTADVPKEQSLKNEIYDSMFKTAAEFNQKFLADADYSMFRKDIGIKDAVRVALYMIQGWNQSNIIKESCSSTLSNETLYAYKKEGEHYIDVLKKTLTDG